MLDGVTHFMLPPEVENIALDMEKNEEPVILDNDLDKPIVALAFKLKDGKYRQLITIRVYQGTFAKGSTIINVRSGKKVKVGRVI